MADITKPLVLFFGIFSTIALATMGAFNTAPVLSLGERLGYWGAVVAVSFLWAVVVWHFLILKFAQIGYWRLGVLYSVCLSIVLAPSIKILSALTLANRVPYEISVFGLMFMVFAVSLCIVLLSHLIGQSFETRSEKAKIFSRISDGAVTQVLHVSVRDHYVDVATDRGVETILLRFSDAIGELDGIEGMQVHRSHWVAKDAVHRTCKADGKFNLVLKNESRVPVSRGYQKQVELEFVTT